MPEHNRARQCAVDAFKAIVGDRWVIDEPAALVPYECDALFHLCERPMAVVLPADEDEVCQVLRYCAQHRIAVTPRGAGTSLSGGATPVSGSVVLGLNRLRSVTVLAAAGQALAGPGVRNVAVSEHAQPHGLFFAPDPSSQSACTIGGNVAENAGGVHCVKYGLTVNNLLGVRMVDGAGQVLDLGSAALDTPGFDFLSLLTGSEGLLGLITQARLRLLPVPSKIRVLLGFFSTPRDTCNAVTAIIGAGIVPAGLEIMDNASLIAADSYSPGLKLRTDAGGALLCELDGQAAEIAAWTEQIQVIFRQHGLLELRQADEQHERLELWAARKNILPALLRTARDVYVADCVVPRRLLGEVLDRINQMAAEAAIEVVQSFHAGDGNLHSVLRYDSRNQGEEARAMALADRIMALALEAGGSISGEHGIGTEKLHGMCWQFGAHELEVFAQIRTLFDPHSILNPGKAIPTLHRCAELGGMHIHEGQMAHPDLPRF
ncbi:FAD-binding protein [Pseudomonas juntendi]|uniref:FAD-linked oxidase C-terminal domain-containing protein n=1 Tax=Pseudomonas TaxID=286 RepID=UPI000D913654|nr:MULTISPECIES: FAD-linked oxidase C-terminal domain-containing protein [Pseudomonas]MBH3385698.1 FAD-binding protein [Pseudomonas juntendi]PYC08169.1 FAD-binding oxidoreductase [Pseudomonas sp. MB-090624]